MIQTLPIDKLEALAATVVKPEPTPRHEGNGSGAPFTNWLDVPRWLSARGVSFTIKDRPDCYGRTVYRLEQCPFDNTHGAGNEVAIYQRRTGSWEPVASTAVAPGVGGNTSREKSARQTQTTTTRHYNKMDDSMSRPRRRKASKCNCPRSRTPTTSRRGTALARRTDSRGTASRVQAIVGWSIEELQNLDANESGNVCRL